jgi:hypothetical protein
MTDQTPTPDRIADLDPLIDRFLDGEVDQADVDALETLLAGDPSARHRFRRVAGLDAALREWAAAAAAVAAWADGEPPAVGSHPARRPSLRSIAGVLAIGLLVGIVSSTVVFAATVPWRLRTASLPLSGFDWGWDAPPSQAGIPDRFDAWGGDFCRLVNTEQGVTPPGGGPMVRMLRSDNATSPGGEVSNSAELWRFIDLRPLRQRLGSGPLRVTFSAAFNMAAIDDADRYRFTVGLHAFPNGNPTEFSALWKQYKADDAAVSSARGRQIADKNPGTWQTVDVQMVVPADATVLLAHTVIGSMHVPHDEAQPVEFPGHYIASAALCVSSEDAAHAQ